jgi:hypothetical protein
MIRLLAWAAMVATAAALVIALNLALLGSTSPRNEPVGRQSAKTKLVRLKPSPGIRQRPPRQTPGLEADD